MDLALFAQILPSPSEPAGIPVWFWSVAFSIAMALLALLGAALIWIAKNFFARLVSRLDTIEKTVSEIHSTVGGTATALASVEQRVETVERYVPEISKLRLRRAGANGGE